MPTDRVIRKTTPAFRKPIVRPEVSVQETAAVSFADLLRLVGEGVADAQSSLDRASASLVEELASTEVSIVPSVRETIGDDGTISYEHGAPQTVSLLDIGVTPTFYQFAQTVIEVSMDIKIVQNDDISEEGERRFGLFADTATVRGERKLHRDTTISSKLTATLVPVPSPLRVEPVRTVTQPEPES